MGLTHWPEMLSLVISNKCCKLFEESKTPMLDSRIDGECRLGEYPQMG